MARDGPRRGRRVPGPPDRLRHRVDRRDRGHHRRGVRPGDRPPRVHERRGHARRDPGADGGGTPAHAAAGLRPRHRAQDVRPRAARRQPRGVPVAVPPVHAAGEDLRLVRGPGARRRRRRVDLVGADRGVLVGLPGVPARADGALPQRLQPARLLPRSGALRRSRAGARRLHDAAACRVRAGAGGGRARGRVRRRRRVRRQVRRLEAPGRAAPGRGLLRARGAARADPRRGLGAGRGAGEDARPRGLARPRADLLPRAAPAGGARDALRLRRRRRLPLLQGAVRARVPGVHGLRDPGDRRRLRRAAGLRHRRGRHARARDRRPPGARRLPRRRGDPRRWTRAGSRARARTRPATRASASASSSRCRTCSARWNGSPGTRSG